MFGNMKCGTALLALVCVAGGPMTGSASAVTVEVARKCEALTAQAFPPRQPGNPAAGLAKGTAASGRKYFSQCLADGGKMNDHAPSTVGSGGNDISKH